jgi:hypothetical protein
MHRSPECVVKLPLIERTFVAPSSPVHLARCNEGGNEMKHSVLAAVAFLSLSTFLSSPTFAQNPNVRGNLLGYQEVPAVSTGASGEFFARISKDGSTITYGLSYSGLEGDVRQAHIHFGQPGVNGGIVVFLCQTTSNPDPTGLAPSCPQEGTVSGTLTEANMVSAAGQGIVAGEFAELVEAIRAKVAYVNVHSTTFPAGEIRAQLNKPGSRER